MSGWFILFLTLHILAVIVAFGPTFAFPLIGAMIEKSPQHALVLTEVMHKIETRMTIPLAVVVPLLGTALIFTAPGNIDLFKSEWLLAAIGLYIVAFSFAVGVQTRTVNRLVGVMQAMPAGPPPEGAAPPPEIARLAKKAKLGGMFLTVLVVVVLILMVWKPGNCQGVC